MVARSFRRGRTLFELENYSAQDAGLFGQALDQLALIDKPLGVTVVRDAMLHPAVGKPGGRFYGGVFDAHFCPVQTAQTRQAAKVTIGDVFLPVARPPIRLAAAMYGGMIFTRYGHLILETIARLWAADQYGDLPIMFQVVAPPKAGGAFYKALDLLGVDPARIIFATDLYQVAELHVPDTGFILMESVNTRYMEFLWSRIRQERKSRGQDAVVAAESGRGAYLSRSALGGQDRKAIDEVAIETALGKAGYDVIGLQTLPFLEQIDFSSRHDRFTGYIGSQFHNLLFRDSRADLDVLYLSDGRPSATYMLIDLLFPGRRIYANVEDFRPFFKVGTTTPFRTNGDVLRRGLTRFDPLHPVALPEDLSEDAQNMFMPIWIGNVVSRLATEHAKERGVAGEEEASAGSRRRIRRIVDTLHPDMLGQHGGNLSRILSRSSDNETDDEAHIRPMVYDMLSDRLECVRK